IQKITWLNDFIKKQSKKFKHEILLQFYLIYIKTKGNPKNLSEKDCHILEDLLESKDEQDEPETLKLIEEFIENSPFELRIFPEAIFKKIKKFIQEHDL